MNKLEKSRNDLKDLLSRGKTFALAYHPDADGMGATKILIHYLLNSGINEADISLYPTNINERIMNPDQEKEVIEKAPDIVIYLDLCIAQKEQLDRLRKSIKHIIIIDHHYFHKGVPERADLCINSIYFDELTRPQVHTASKLMDTLFYNTKNDWLEIIGLEGDVAIPSMPGTLSFEATQILNLLGLIQRDDEPGSVRDKRCNSLLKCLIDSHDLPTFLDNFKKLKDLHALYKRVTEDIEQNVKKIEAIKPKLKFHSNSIYCYEINSVTGYDIIGQILKAHIPYLGYNSTYIIHQRHHMKSAHQIFMYTNNLLIDCFKVASKNGGGGHTNRSGFRIEGISVEKKIDEIIEDIKEMIVQGEHEYSPKS
jgi:hypothetical protein